jgi:putative glutamine amidotransferase
MTAAKPLIAIPAYRLAAGRVTKWSDSGFAVPASYVDAIHRAGGRAVLLTSPDDSEPAEILAPFDGLMLIGGGDIDPFLYDTEPHEQIYGMNRDRDELEIGLAKAAAETGMATLAICRGIQIANVAFGGTLHQHLPDLGATEHGVPAGAEGAYVAGEKRIQEGSLLAGVLGTDRITAKCSHHQAVDILGEGLKPTAWTDDGIVEGLEREDGWFVAVQWHPEVTAAQDPAQQALFDAFVTQAKA